MTRAQEIALSNPCIEAEDCMDLRFKHYLKPMWSIILTVNSGFE